MSPRAFYYTWLCLLGGHAGIGLSARLAAMNACQSMEGPVSLRSHQPSKGLSHVHCVCFCPVMSYSVGQGSSYCTGSRSLLIISQRYLLGTGCAQPGCQPAAPRRSCRPGSHRAFPVRAHRAVPPPLLFPHLQQPRRRQGWSQTLTRSLSTHLIVTPARVPTAAQARRLRH